MIFNHYGLPKMDLSTVVENYSKKPHFKRIMKQKEIWKIWKMAKGKQLTLTKTPHSWPILWHPWVAASTGQQHFPCDQPSQERSPLLPFRGYGGGT